MSRWLWTSLVGLLLALNAPAAWADYGGVCPPNTVVAGPSVGNVSAAPLCRAIVLADLPINQIITSVNGGAVVTTFGADPAGLKDSTQAFIAAVASGKPIVVTQGTYLVQSNQIILSAQQSLTCTSGPGTTAIVTNSPTGDVIQIGGLYSSVSGCLFNTNVARTAGCYINLINGAVHTRIFHNVMLVPWRGICITGATVSDTKIYDMDIYSTATGGDSIYINSPAFATTIGPSFVMDNSPTPSAQPEAGIRIDQAVDITIEDGNIIHAGDCLLLDPGPGQTVSYVKESLVWHDTCGQHGTLLNAQGGIIQQYESVNGWWATAQKEGVRAQTSAGGTVKNVELTGGQFLNNGLAANAPQVYAADAGVSDFRILGGYAANNANSIGVRIGPVSGSLVTHLRAGPTAGWGALLTGIQIDSGATSFIVEGNDVRGNTNALSIVPLLDGVNNVVMNNLGSTFNGPLGETQLISQTPTVDTSFQATALNNGSTIVFPSGGGLFEVVNNANGEQALYLLGGGAVTLLGSSAASPSFVVGSSPAAGKIGVAFAGGTSYEIVSNFGSNISFSQFFLKTRSGG